MADNLILELTADRGAGDELVRFSVFPVAQSTDVHPRLIGIPEYSVEAGLWIWQTQTTSGVGNAEVISADGYFDWLHDAAVRDKPARLLEGDQGSPFGSYSEVASLMTDFIGTGQNGRLIIVFAALDVLLQNTWQTDFYLDSTPNARIRGLPVPVTLGHAWQVPAVLEDPTALEYAVHTEAPFNVIEVQSNGNPATGSQWDPLGRGFEMNITPAGRITAELEGSKEQTGFTLGSDLVRNGNFSSWSSDNPSSWTVNNESSPAKVITQAVGGQCTFRTDGAFDLDGPSIEQVILVAGNEYRITFNLNQYTGGNDLRLFDGSAEIARYNTTGSKSEDFVAQGTKIKLQYFNVFGTQQSARIDNVVVKEKIPTFNVIDEIDGLIPYVAEQTGWDPADIDTAGLTTLQTAIGTHELGLWLDNTTTGSDILRKLLGQFLVTSYVDSTGTLKVGRLVDPSDIAGSPVLEITPEMIPAGETPVLEDDLMPGLTDTFGGRRNWLPIAPENSAGAITSDMQKREDVAAEHRFVLTGANALDPFYAWAVKRCVFSTTVQNETELQALADHVTDIASQRRKLIRVPILLQDVPDLQPFQKVNITWPGLGLQSGVDAVLVGFSRRFLGSRVNLILWR